MATKGAHLVKGSAAAKAHMAKLRRMVGKKKGNPKPRAKARKNPGPASNPGNSSPKKKFTVTKGLDLFSIAAPAIHKAAIYAETGDINALKSITGFYTGWDAQTGNFQMNDMVRGYGGAGFRVFEKKLFKAVGVRPPRTQMKTIGDVLDYVTYFGQTALDVYNNRASPREAIRLAHLDQNGVDLARPGWQALQPMVPITTKLAPYIIQKKVMKMLRKSGINLSLGM